MESQKRPSSRRFNYSFAFAKYQIPGDPTEVMEQRLKSSQPSIKIGIPSEGKDNFVKDQKDFCFRESLEVFSEDGNDPGKFFVSVEKESDVPEVYQVYVSLNHKVDGIKQESTLLGRVTPKFTTLEEMRIDSLQLGNKKIDHHVYILNESDNYHVSVSSFDGDKWDKAEANFPIETNTHLMGEAANYLFLRMSAMEGNMKGKTSTAILNDGSLHSCRYDFRRSMGRFGRNRKELITVAAKKTVNGPKGIQVYKWILSLGGGYILKHKRKFPPGSLVHPPVECGIGVTISDTEEESVSTTPEESEVPTDQATISSDKMVEESATELEETGEGVELEAFLLDDEAEEPKEAVGRGPEDAEEKPEERIVSAGEEGDKPYTAEGEENKTEDLLEQGDEEEIGEDTTEKFPPDVGEKIEAYGEEEVVEEGKGTEEIREELEEMDRVKAEEDLASLALGTEYLSTVHEVHEESDEVSGQDEESTEKDNTLAEPQEEDIEVEEEEGEADEEEEEEPEEGKGEGSSDEDEAEEEGEGSEVEGEGGEGGSSEEDGEGSETASAAKEKVHRVFSFEQEGYFPLVLTPEVSEDGIKLEEILRDIKGVKRECRHLKKDIRQERREEEKWRRKLRGSMLEAAGPLTWRLLEGERRMRISRYARILPGGRVDQGPIPLKYRWREDPQLLAAYKSCKIRRRMDIRSYSDDQKELLDFLSDFLMHVLIDTPEDVVKYAKEYFAAFK
ncbi:uncharacterized protein LOC124157554 [Ischnura elegans]|uniref:uncharacterized protein LOC124157554 n=1 Tax=Ischnura elegans TaxID=197161 RepID=UPI001ED8AF39|nr:uncharacterized protein LOC124157554 [Ischnura elegans]